MSILIIIIVYALVLLAGCKLQTKLLFFPGKLPADFQFKLTDGAEEIFIETADKEKINAIFYPGSKKEVIVYFHGNAGDLSSWQDVVDDLRPLDYNLLIIDFRGFGKSTGKFTEQGFYEDGQAAYKFLISRGFYAEQIIVYGRSLGTGIATYVAKENKVKALILETPYYSIERLANKYYWFILPSLYLKFRFKNNLRVPDIDCPSLYLHGDRDEVIPLEHAEALFALSKGNKTFVKIKGGNHNDLGQFKEYHKSLKEFLEGI